MNRPWPVEWLDTLLPDAIVAIRELDPAPEEEEEGDEQNVVREGGLNSCKMFSFIANDMLCKPMCEPHIKRRRGRLNTPYPDGPLENVIDIRTRYTAREEKVAEFFMASSLISHKHESS